MAPVTKAVSKSKKKPRRPRPRRPDQAGEDRRQGRQASNGSRARPANGVQAKAAGQGRPSGKRIYFFGGGKAEGNKDMKNLLGGKGANLAEMTNIGVPVPPGFTITTDVCTEFYRSGRKLPKGAGRGDARRHRARWRSWWAPSSATRRTRCWSRSARARAPSMPGMMDTILNLGLNDATAEGLAEEVGQRAVRLRQLPPLRRHVRRRRAGHEARAQGGPRSVRGHPVRKKKPSAACRTTPTWTPRP